MIPVRDIQRAMQPHVLDWITRKLAALSPGNVIRFANELGAKIYLWGTTYGIGINSLELTLFVDNGAEVKVRRPAWDGTVVGRVVTTAGDVAKVATRRESLQLWPLNGAKDTPAAGDVVWALNAGGGPAAIRWKSTGTTVTNRWVQATGSIPMDYASGLSIKMRVKVVDGGASQNLQAWQYYVQICNDAYGDTWNVAAPSAFGSTTIGTAWTTITIATPIMPGGTGAGSHVALNIGPGATAVSWSSDILLGDIWLEYTPSY
jgi:hypothetical protein